MAHKSKRSKNRRSNNSIVSQPQEAVETGHRIVLTRGDELIAVGDARRSFQQELERAVSGQVSISDYTAAKAFAASATAHACIEKRAAFTSSIPLKVVDANGNDVSNSPLSYFLSSASIVQGLALRSSLIWGRTYLRKRRNQAGWPTGLEWVNPIQVREIADSNGNVESYDITPITAWGMGAHERVPANEVIYWQMFDTDPMGNGMSKFEAAWRSVSVEQGIATHAAAFFVNSAQPDGFLTFDIPLSDAQLKEARDAWRKEFKGSKNAHKTSVMPGGARWNPVTVSPKDLAMGELDDKQAKKICAVIDVDPTMVGLEPTTDPLGASSTYQAVEVAHIRNVTLPFMRMYLLQALNDQWAHTDFDRPDYTLIVDEANIAAFNDANLLRADTAANLSQASVSDFDESRSWLGLPARGADYIKRDPTHPGKLFLDGASPLNEYRRMVGLPPLMGGDVLLIGGQLVPLTRLMEVSNKQANTIGQFAMSPFGAMPFTKPNDGLPKPEPAISVTKPEPLALPEPGGSTRGSSQGAPEAYAILSLSNNPWLMAYQSVLRQNMPDWDGIRWTPPSEFHISLVYSKLISDAQLQRVIGSIEGRVPWELELKTLPLSSFEGDGQTKPLIIPVELNEELRTLQYMLAQKVKATGAPLSEFSDPEAYKPHITLAYITFDVDIPTIDLTETLIARDIVFSRGTHQTVELVPLLNPMLPGGKMGNPEPMPGGEIKPAVGIPIEELTAALTDPSRRGAVPLSLSLSFAENAFVRYCRRALSESLTGQGINAAWVSEDEWRMTLAQSARWTPAAASALIRAANFRDTRPLDFKTSGFVRQGDSIYLKLDGDAAAMRQSARLDLEGADLSPDDLAGDGILICTAAGDYTLPEAESYPLVGNTVVLSKGGDRLHTWTLQGSSPARSKELQSWELVIRRKGRDHAFEPDVLRASDVAAFVTDTLAAGVEIDDVFELAAAMLRGQYTWRAYPETRTDFIRELMDLFKAGQANEINRRNFAARLRALLRRFGLLAFHDGLAEAGQDRESLSMDELKTFRAWQDEQSGYVTNLGQEIFREGISELEAANKVYMWTDVSLGRIKVLGVIAGGDPMMRRVLGQVESGHCPECARLADQVHKASEWHKRDLLIGSSKCSCKQGCHCSFEVTDQDEQGDWL